MKSEPLKPITGAEAVILAAAYLVSSVVSIACLMSAYDFVATRYFQ